jgi:hypothetical protein
VREAFQDLFKNWGKQQNRIFLAEYEQFAPFALSRTDTHGTRTCENSLHPCVTSSAHGLSCFARNDGVGSTSPESLYKMCL